MPQVYFPTLVKSGRGVFEGLISTHGAYHKFDN